MSYVNAPATKMLATHCALCQRPLLDAASVELGIGPDCAKRYAANLGSMSEATRLEANKHVHELALLRSQHKAGEDVGSVMTATLKALHELGLDVLAQKAAKAVADVTLARDEDKGVIAVGWKWGASSRHELLIIRLKALKASWKPDAKVWTVDVSQAAALNAVLVKFFAGKIALGPKGPYCIAG